MIAQFTLYDRGLCASRQGLGPTRNSGRRAHLHYRGIVSGRFRKRVLTAVQLDRVLAPLGVGRALIVIAMWAERRRPR